MGRTSGEQDVDDRFVRPAVSSTVFGLQQAGQGGPGYAERANGKERPTREAIAKSTRGLSNYA
jgi:hypothetical protein